MGLDNGAADGQSHAGAIRLRREERIEDLVQVRWEPYARIDDRNLQVITAVARRPERDFALAVHLLHRLDAVHHQVQENLLQLYAISHDGWEICRKLGTDRHAVSYGLAAHQHEDFSDDLVDVHQLVFGPAFLEQPAHAVDDFSGPGRVPDRPRRGRARLFQVRFLTSQP